MATDPLQGGPTPSQNPGADPVKVLAPKPPGQPGHDDHDVSGPPAPETIKRGYEEDVYDTKTVFSVPALVLLFFVLAFGTTSLLFAFLSKPVVNPSANPQAKARNEADLNTRIARIGRGKEVDQPRLDQLPELEDRGGDPYANPRVITRPKKEKGNSPQLHPEDLIPDPKNEGHAPLFATDKERVGIDKTLALGDDALKGLFKSSAPPLPEVAAGTAVTGSSAGRGASPMLPEPKKTEPAPAPKGGKP